MITFFLKKSKLYFTLYSILFVVVTALLLSSFFTLFNTEPTHSESLENTTTIMLFIKIVLVGPFVETFFFQAIIIEVINNHYKNYKYRAILTSGLVFGSLHFLNTYNFIYTLNAILMGFSFAFIYVIAKMRKDINPILITVLCHSSINFIAFLGISFL